MPRSFRPIASHSPRPEQRPQVTEDGLRILQAAGDQRHPHRGESLEMSLVVPVFNGSRTIAAVVEEIHRACSDISFEVILVNDGSSDDSEEACAALLEKFPATVTLVQLARNFGEHNAVMAGLCQARGDFAAILDDDGQNSPQDAMRMLALAREKMLDVVYARYGRRQHSLFRVAGSWLNDRTANLLLGKPRGLYLSSFKVISRFVVDQITCHGGPFPYIDGMILRVTDRIGQIDATHRPRQGGASGYTMRKLVSLWLNMCMGYSMLPLRLCMLMGVLISSLSAVAGACVLLYGLSKAPASAMTVPCVLAALGFCAGLQFLFIGLAGEYAGRTLMHQSGTPQYVVRYTRIGAAAQTPVTAAETPVTRIA